MRVTVSVTNDLVVDQRVHKVCSTLHKEGYQIKLIGRRFRTSAELRREYSTVRLRLLFNKTFFFYMEYNIRLFFYLLFEKTDAFLSNDTDTLPANYFVSFIRRKPLIFDAHELMPETPEVFNRKWVKGVWIFLEKIFFPRLKNSYTVCQSIADYYNGKYGTHMQVVRNIPFANLPIVATDNPINCQGKKVILYQGAVNIGRGIEWVMDAMHYLDEFVFYVVGDGDVLDELRQKSIEQNLTDRVIFTGRIPFNRLPSYTRSADIGVNLLKSDGLSYYYALPNRIFDYIRSELPVLATDFPEIRRIVATYDVGILINNYEPQKLADSIRELVRKGKNKEGFQKANSELTWEKESITLLKVVKDAFSSQNK